jgi:hypothetical protein
VKRRCEEAYERCAILSRRFTSSVVSVCDQTKASTASRRVNASSKRPASSRNVIHSSNDMLRPFAYASPVRIDARGAAAAAASSAEAA